MPLTDNINNINNEGLKAKLLAKFNDLSPRSDVLVYISRWARISLRLRILFSIFSLGLAPLIYLLWAKITHQHHLNWVTKPTLDSIDAISKINETTEQNIETATNPQGNTAEPHLSEEENDHQDPVAPPYKEADTSESEDTLTLRKKDLTTGKFYIGTQKGFLYVGKDGKFEKHDLMKGPIINIDFTEITENNNKYRLALITHDNGHIDAYNMNDYTKTLFVLHVGKWINNKNNIVDFDKDGNIRAQSPERDVILWDRMRTIDSLAELASKERSKLTSSVEKSSPIEERSNDPLKAEPTP